MGSPLKSDFPENGFLVRDWESVSREVVPIQLAKKTLEKTLEKPLEMQI